MNYSETVVLEKTVVIDYLTLSIDFLKVQESSTGHWVVGAVDLYNELLFLLGHETGYLTLQPDRPLHGMMVGFRLGEHIRISYGGHHTKSAEGDYPLILELTGKACREFENYLNGNWLNLFKFVLNHEKFRVTRFDLAIDDYTGNEITFYELIELFKMKSFTTNFRSYTFIESGAIFSNQLGINGESLYFGKRDSENQLIIYNKFAQLLEEGRRSEVNSDYHYRYEMRFAGEKAKLILETYYQMNIDHASNDFMNFASSLLLQLLEFKDPESNRAKVRDRKIHPGWLKFLENVAKSELRISAPEEVTLEKKEEWMEYSMGTTFLELFTTKDIPEALSFMLELALGEIDDLKNDKLVRINKRRKQLGKHEISNNDLKEIKKTMQTIANKGDV